MSAESSPPPPLLGALMRMPLDLVVARMITRLHEHGFDDLVPAHLTVLRYPGPNGQRPIELAAQANISKQALNYLLGQLERLGYLERRADPRTSRSKRVHLTPRGESTRPVIRAAVREVEAEWESAIGAWEIERLRTILLRLNRSLGSPGT